MGISNTTLSIVSAWQDIYIWDSPLIAGFIDFEKVEILDMNQNIEKCSLGKWKKRKAS